MKRLTGLSLLMTLFFLSACTATKNQEYDTSYYTLEYNPSGIEDRPPLSVALKVDGFGVAPMYNTDLIVYRDRSFKRST